MAQVPKKHNLLTSPTTSESLGISSSSNITAQSSGFEGDDSSSLFPQLKRNKDWESETSSNMHSEVDTRTNAGNRK